MTTIQTRLSPVTATHPIAPRRLPERSSRAATLSPANSRPSARSQTAARMR